MQVSSYRFGCLWPRIGHKAEEPQTNPPASEPGSQPTPTPAPNPFPIKKGDPNER